MRLARRMVSALPILLIVATGSLSPAVRADPLFQVTDLGAIQVAGLNNSGQVLSSTAPSAMGGSSYTPFVYNSYGPDAGQQILLPLQTATAINNQGTVAGTPASSIGYSPLVLDDSSNPSGNPTPIPTALPGSRVATGTIAGLNNANQVVGASNTQYTPGSEIYSGWYNIGPQHAILSSGGTITDLGTLGGPTSAATAINNAGQIVGTADVAPFVSHAFLYSAGKMIDLGGLPGYNSTTATAINASGQVVGYSTDLHTYESFLYSAGKLIPLGSLPGGDNTRALGINASGTIIGTSNGLAFLDRNGVMTDLNTLLPPGVTFHLTSANDINDSGQIVAMGTDSRGVSNAYLLTPAGMPAPVAPVLTGSEVPEPSVLAFGVMVGILAGGRRFFRVPDFPPWRPPAWGRHR